jgi:hypothetical protein
MNFQMVTNIAQKKSSKVMLRNFAAPWAAAEGLCNAI